MMRPVYLDNCATTQPLPEVIRAMAEAMSVSFGNPSSAHARGDIARQVLEEARSAVADLMGVEGGSVIFTSSATEATNLAIRSALASSGDTRRIITSTVEHSSVLKLCEKLSEEGYTVDVIPVDKRGVIELEQLQRSIEKGADVLSAQWVNNETGVIQPIERIAEIAAAHGVLLHMDAAQAFGKLKSNFADLPVDFVSVTAHKIHGPQGVGALYVRPGRRVQPLIFGGPQEAGRRAGTENLPGIAGFGCAARLRSQRMLDVVRKVKDLRDEFERRILVALPNVGVNGGATARVAGSTNLRFDGIDGQALVVKLDQQGLACSQSSACTNMRPEPSYVLRAMGLSETEAYASVRFGFSEMNTQDDLLRAADCVVDAVTALRRFEGAGAFAA